MSRTYHISDFAAFLRKYGDAGRDRGDREESARDDNRSSRPDRGANQGFRQQQNGHDRWRTIYRARNREYSLRESEVQTLSEVGKSIEGHESYSKQVFVITKAGQDRKSTRLNSS